MLRKYAMTQTLEAFQVPTNASRRALRKAAHRVSFTYEPRPGYLYVRSRAISSRCNDNFDEFPAAEIKKAYKTFIGKPVFVNHHNDDHRRARGVIIDAALHEDRNADGSPDTWAEVLMEVDAVKFPKLAKAILAGEVDRTSMGCDVQFSKCSACGNVATNPAEYCHHIPAMKGQRIYRHTASGRREGHLVREICSGLGFFENSLLVEEPADPTAYVWGVDDRGMKMVASRKTAVDEDDFDDYDKERHGMHPDAACPSCGSKNFRPAMNSGSFAICDDCGASFHGSKSFEQLRSDQEFAKMNRDQWVKDREKGDKTFKHITDKPTKPIVDWGEDWDALRERQLPEQVNKGPMGIPFDMNTERGKAMFEQRRDRALNKSVPWRPAEGPIDPRHLSSKGEPISGHEDFVDIPNRKRAISDEEIQRGLNLPSAEQGHKDITREKAKSFADALMAPLYEPYGGEENYHLHQHNENMMDLKRRYEGGSGKFGFDHEDDGGEAYYEIRHPSGWIARHYADGPMAEIRHRATPNEGHDVLNIGAEVGPDHNIFGHHRPPENFGHKELKAELDNWVNNSGRGTVEHLEGPYGDPRIRRWKRTMGTRKRALDEVKAPPEVDTLRDEECPVCGEAEVYDGERCPICGFIAPPAMFRDPDLDMAKQVDLRGGQNPDVGPGQMDPDEPGGGLIDPSQLGPGQMPGEMPGQMPGMQGTPEEQLQHPDQLNPNGEVGEPGTPGDGVPDLFCPACGEGVDAGQPLSQPADDPNAAPAAAGPEEGMPCPNCGQATLLSPGDMEQAGLMAPEELPEGQEGGEVPEGDPNAEGAQEGVPGAEQGPPEEGGNADEEPAQEGDEQEPPQDEAEDSGEPAVDDDDPAAKKRDKNSKGASMSKAVEAAMVAQQSVIDSLTRKNAVLEAQLAFLAKAAGVETQFAAIQRQADINNPASPVPDPGEEQAYETTEQALAPETMDNPQTPGETPGSVNRVPAEQTDVPMSPGVTMPTSPANQLVDVTAPVAGTNTGEVPLNQTRIETDVRVGDPMANAGSDQAKMFPWIIGSSGGDPIASNRTMASLRLAKLRKNAGLAQGDEFRVATAIETDASLPDVVIANEIRTLESLGKVASKRERPAGLVPRAASGGRSAPSMASLGQSTAVSYADDDASDLFLD
jgi:hypothetical protein